MRSPLLLRAGLFLLLFLAAVIVGYFILRPSDEPAVFHPSQLDKRLVDESVRSEKGEHHISDFDLIDQEGKRITLADVKGKVLLADFFFTTCGSICPKMSTQMERVQERFLNDDRFLLLSHSVTPEVDSVAQLKLYAELHHADSRRWHFLTGDRAQIYRLARRSYFAALDEGDGGPDDFVHTENFVLVDQQGRLRGFYDGTKTVEVDRAMKDIAWLLEHDH